MFVKIEIYAYGETLIQRRIFYNWKVHCGQ